MNYRRIVRVLCVGRIPGAVRLGLMFFVLALAVPALAQRGSSGPQRGQGAGPGHRYGLPTAPPRSADSIRIASYNTLNLFDHVDDPSLQGEFDDIKMATPDDRCRAMAAAIKSLDADIIALEEVESLDALKWFRDTYLPDAGYKWLASYDVGYYRGVECSVMSRFEITNARVWADESLDDVRREGMGWASVPADARRGLKYQRSPLAVTVKVSSDYELTIFAVHHKAGRDFDFHREAEALKNIELIERVRREEPARNVIVMGDFNAAPWDKSVRVYLQAGLIDTLAHRTTSGDDEALIYKTHESNRVLDYILLNSAAHREFIVGSAFVLGTLYPGDQYDFRKDTPPPGYASDHYPVAIDLMPSDMK